MAEAGQLASCKDEKEAEGDQRKTSRLQLFMSGGVSRGLRQRRFPIVGFCRTLLMMCYLLTWLLRLEAKDYASLRHFYSRLDTHVPPRLRRPGARLARASSSSPFPPRFSSSLALRPLHQTLECLAHSWTSFELLFSVLEGGVSFLPCFPLSSLA